MDWEDRQRFNALAAQVQKTTEQLAELLAERDRLRNVAAMDSLREIVKDLYVHALNYTNLVIAAGYAGSFAIWQFTQHVVTKRVRLWSAMLLLLSIILFIGHQVHDTLREGWRMRNLSEAMLNLPEHRRLEALQAFLGRNQLRAARTWVFFVVPTVATGFLGGILLLAAFVAALFGYVFLP